MKKQETTKIKYCLFHKPVFWTVFSLSVGVISFCVALIAQMQFSIVPCILCVYQRYVLVTLIIALGWLAVAYGSGWQKILKLVVRVLAFSGFCLSAHHFGVEQKWWKGPDQCSIGQNTQKKSIDEQFKDFQASLKGVTTVIPRCDEVNWRILGVSATVWTGLLFLFILGVHVSPINKER